MTREEQLFNDALSLPPADRAAFLARACAGDEALHRRLGELLEAYASSGDFLAASVLPPPPAVLEEKPGDVLGRYTLGAKLGEGGCGAVYLAEQHEPVRRQVALKVIKLGMDTREVIARFEAERQALAMMDHPGIARVYDAGATAAGRPYFVMEFVDGVPITQFCDAHQLPVPERLALFADLCLALQHAHQKGIIHRDLKPSNILVTLQDGAPRPKIIDFGIAKATQGKLTAHTLVTRLEQMIGTPVYMSPEQADLRDTDIDTRSDIYSLGVLLYELLSGRPPFDPHSLLQAGVAEIRRIIRETDPPRPSAAVSTLADADRTTVAQRRRASPTRLPSALKGDLDWIVMRCLEKQRDRRYGTAEELGRDIRRHLQHEPVSARPPSALYRTRKFISRHRLACASAAALALAIVAGVAASTWQAIRATRAEREAIAERDAANAARAETRHRQQQAETLLSFMLGDISPELKKFGTVTVRGSLGDRAMEYFSAVSPEKLSDIEVARQSKAFTQIGEIRMDEAKYAEAADAFTKAYASAAALTRRHPGDADRLFERAQAEYGVGAVARRRGDRATQHEWWTRYRDSALALVALEGATPRAQLELIYGQHNLALLNVEQGNLAAARAGFLAEQPALTTLRTIKPADTELQKLSAECATWLGVIAESSGEYAAAFEHFSEAAARYEALASAEPAKNSWRAELATSLTGVSRLHAILGRKSEAATAIARASSLLDALVGLDPKNRRWQGNALAARLTAAELLVLGAAPPDGASLLAGIRAGLEALVAAEPASPSFRRSLAKSWRLEARAHLTSDRAAARTAISRALALTETLLREARADRFVRAEFAQSSLLAGRLALLDGDSPTARRRWEQGLAALGTPSTDSMDWVILDPAAQALVLLGRSDEALPLVERLKRNGYQPLDPLAAASLASASSTQKPTIPR